MAAPAPQCPHCHQLVSQDVHTCPHCGVYLHMPDYPGFAVHTQASQASARLAQPRSAPLSSVAFETLPDAIKQLDAAATTTITTAGVLIAFYTGAIFAGKVLAGLFFNAIVYVLPILLLLTTMLCSVRVLYPAGYLTDDHATLFKKKDERLRLSLLALVIAIALLALSVFVYLLRPASAP